MTAEARRRAEEPILVLCFDPDLAETHTIDGGLAVVIADGHVQVEGATATVRKRFRELGLFRRNDEIQQLAPRHVVVQTTRRMRPGGILRAILHGGEWFKLVDAPGSSYTVNARGAFVIAVERKVARFIKRLPWSATLERLMQRRFDPFWPDLDSSRSLTQAIVDFSKQDQVLDVPGSGTLRIVHHIGTLGSGGAERQLTYLALRAARDGHMTRVLTSQPMTGDEGHFLKPLSSGGVDCRCVGIHPPHLFPAPYVRRSPLRPLPEGLCRRFEEHCVRENLIPLVHALLEETPDVLHCWLDEPNIVGALAGLIAGVPRILISTRNLNPSHFPRFHKPWFRESYRILAESERVTFVANSRAGADDYAAWSGVDVTRFHVVYNGYSPPRGPLTAEERFKKRTGLGIPPDAFVVIGCFRLAEEKRPFDFVEVVARLRKRVPRLRVLHIGVGGWSEEVQRAALECGLEASSLKFLGRQADVSRYVGLADAMLLTSSAEGCPNVSLESQALGVPIVLTRAGGAAETVDEGRTGFVCEVGDVEGLVGRLASLAEDLDLRSRMSGAGPSWTAERFGLEAMVTRHHDLYRAGV